MRHQTFMIILASILLASCEQKKKPLSFYGNEEVVEDTTEVVQSQAASQVSYDADSEVAVPFVEQRGVKLIDVTVNRQFTVKMILDSGCSGTLISIAEAKYLYERVVLPKMIYLAQRNLKLQMEALLRTWSSICVNW